MSDPIMCRRQDSCPLLLEALHQKVTAEADARLAKADAQDAKSAAQDAKAAFAGKRTLFNEFYALAVRCRKAQRRYFAEKTQAALIASKEAERALDAHIAMLSRSSSRNVHVQGELNFAEAANG